MLFLCWVSGPRDKSVKASAVARTFLRDRAARTLPLVLRALSDHVDTRSAMRPTFLRSGPNRRGETNCRYIVDHLPKVTIQPNTLRGTVVDARCHYALGCLM